MENDTDHIHCEDELTLQRLLDQELDADANELVFHHLKGCQRCSGVFQELKESKSLCEGQLGFEDEGEAAYSVAVLTRVRGAIGTATISRPIETASQPALSGNGKASISDLIGEDDVVINFGGHATRKQSGLQPVRDWFRSIDMGFLLRPGVITVVAAILILVVGVAFWLRTPTTVSAAELLARSAAADDAVASHADQVLRRTINLETRVGRTASLSDSSRSAVHRQIETWQSADKGLAARRLFDEEDRLLAGEWKKSDGSRLLYQEGMQPQLQAASDRRPSTLLSAGEVWLLNVSAKDFSALVGNASSARVEQTQGTYVINYGVTDTNSAGLVKAMLVLSKADLHTIQETLLVNSPGNNPQFIEYKFAETSFERRTPNTVAPAVFEPDPAVLALMKGKVEAAKAKPEVESSASAPGPPPTPAVATAELEVDVLEKLNRVNAFSGEQLSLTRTPENRLLVSGVVETSERKNEILRSLGELAKNPAVKIDVSTVAEAQKRQTSARTGNLTVQDVQVSENTIPVDAELRSYLSRKGLSGEQLEHEIEQLSRRVLAHSTRARSHALALKQIAERFSPADLETMDQSSLIRWRALIKEHAQFFRRELEQVRQELSPIFPGASASGPGANFEIANDRDIARAAKSLFELASVTDNGLRRSLSLSSERASDAPVRSPQFWHSFASAESLAAKISER